MNCFINSGKKKSHLYQFHFIRHIDLDKRRVKHLASSVQELLLTEIKYEDTKYIQISNTDRLLLFLCLRKHDELLMDNRHILYHMIDLRQTHIEEFNMLLILLLVTRR